MSFSLEARSVPAHDQHAHFASILLMQGAAGLIRLPLASTSAYSNMAWVAASTTTTSSLPPTRAHREFS